MLSARLQTWEAIVRLERSKGIAKASLDGVEFAMRRGEGGHLRYTVERAALEHFAGRFLAIDELLSVFAARQDDIERIVRIKGTEGVLEHGRVIVRLQDCQPADAGAKMQQTLIWLPKPMLAAIDTLAKSSLAEPDRNAMIRELLGEALEARKTRGGKARTARSVPKSGSAPD
jgi:hypothetical protein